MVTKAHHALLLAYLVRRWRAAFPGEGRGSRRRWPITAGSEARAWPDGLRPTARALDMPAYFAYSSGRPSRASPTARWTGATGAQVDRVMGCPWCAVWAREGMLEEGALLPPGGSGDFGGL